MLNNRRDYVSIIDVIMVSEQLNVSSLQTSN